MNISEFPIEATTTEKIDFFLERNKRTMRVKLKNEHEIMTRERNCLPHTTEKELISRKINNTII